jgi:hypothetical protein
LGQVHRLAFGKRSAEGRFIAAHNDPHVGTADEGRRFEFIDENGGGAGVRHREVTLTIWQKRTQPNAQRALQDHAENGSDPACGCEGAADIGETNPPPICRAFIAG